MKSKWKQIISLICLALIISMTISDNVSANQAVVHEKCATADFACQESLAVSENTLSENDISDNAFEDSSDEAGNTEDIVCLVDDEAIATNDFGAEEDDNDPNKKDDFVYGEDGTVLVEYNGYASRKVIIPAKVTRIASTAFADDKTRIEKIAFEEGSVCMKIDNGVFENCEKLDEVILPDSLVIIGDNAFKHTKIRNITIPDHVTEIGSYAFADNENLSKVTFGAAVKKLGQYAFSGCSILRTVNINSLNMTGADPSVFDACAIKEVNFGDKVTRVPDNLFSYSTFLPNTRVTVSDNIIAIGDNAFKGAKNFSLEIIGENLAEIGQGAFQDTAIPVFNLPASVKTIGASAFAGCKNITEFKVPYKTEIIGAGAFADCENLKKVYLSKRLLQISNDAFLGCPSNLKYYILRNTEAEKWVLKNVKNQECIIYCRNIDYQLRKGINNAANPTMFPEDEEIVLYPPTRAGFIFDGWYTDGKYKKPFESTKDFGKKARLYAKWTPITYTIRYELNAVDASNKKNELRTTRTCNKSFKLYAPVRKGYFFKGWYDNPEFSGEAYRKLPVTLAKNVTLYAKWGVKSYNVIFDPNGGILTDEAGKSGAMDPILDVEYPALFRMPAAGIFESRLREGYIYTGWNTMKSGSLYNNKGVHYDFRQETSSLTEKNGKNVKLYAEWTPIEYSIEYVLDGGTNNAKNPLTHNVVKSVQLRNPVKPGCTFKGWYSDPEFTVRVRRIPRNYPSKITLYARWE